VTTEGVLPTSFIVDSHLSRDNLSRNYAEDESLANATIWRYHITTEDQNKIEVKKNQIERRKLIQPHKKLVRPV
jgi:hypothetical protein